MQVWDQVKFKEGTDNAGKAGLVVKKDGDRYTVKLDENGALVGAVDADCELLGR